MLKAAVIALSSRTESTARSPATSFELGARPVYWRQVPCFCMQIQDCAHPSTFGLGILHLGMLHNRHAPPDTSKLIARAYSDLLNMGLSESKSDVRSPPALPHSLTPSLPPSLTHSRTHSLTHSLAHSLTHALTHSRSHSLTHSLSRSLSHSLTHALTHSFSLSLSLSLSLSHSLSDSG